jgi:16S rRNA (cytosine1402-N4)-methyltransferase
VNESSPELEAGLAPPSALKAGGRLCVVTFHSLEAIVKTFLSVRAGRTPSGSRHAPPLAAGAAELRAAVQRAHGPSEAELAANPRARSAKLRARCAPRPSGGLRELAEPVCAASGCST